MSRASLAVVVVAACSAPPKPKTPVQTAPVASEAALVVRDVYISNPELVPEAEKTPNELVQPQRAVIELTVNAAFDCPPNAFVVNET